MPSSPRCTRQTEKNPVPSSSLPAAPPGASPSPMRPFPGGNWRSQSGKTAFPPPGSSCTYTARACMRRAPFASAPFLPSDTTSWVRFAACLLWSAATASAVCCTRSTGRCRSTMFPICFRMPWDIWRETGAVLFPGRTSGPSAVSRRVRWYFASQRSLWQAFASQASSARSFGAAGNTGWPPIWAPERLPLEAAPSRCSRAPCA